MKKLIAIFLLMLLTFSAMACKPAEKPSGVNPPPTTSDTPAEEDPTTE